MIQRGQLNTSDRILTSLSMTPTPTEHKPLTKNAMSFSSYYQPQEQKNPLIPENDPYKVVNNYQTRLGAGGNEVPERKNTSLGNALMTALDVMQRPQYAVTNVLQDLTDTKRDTLGDVIKGSFQGLTGQRKSSTTDILNNVGWKNDDSKKWYQSPSNTLRNVVGFAGDVVLDPTTYLSGGTMAMSKLAGKEGTEKALKKALANSTDDIATVTSRIASALGTTAEDVAVRAGKHGAQSETVMRIADALGGRQVYKGIDKAGDVAVDTMTNADRIKNILDNGLDYVNKDVIGGFSNEARAVMSELDLARKGVSSTRSRSFSQLFGKNNLASGDYNIKALLTKDFATNSDVGENLVKLFSSDGTIIKHYTDVEKADILNKIYAGTNDASRIGHKFTPSVYTDREIGIMETLVNTFGVNKKASIVDTAQHTLAAMTKPNGDFKDVNNVLQAFDTEKQLANQIKKINGGVEFASGLQRVYDDVAKKFIFRYDNPFTHTVTPIADLTKYINPVKEKASQIAMGVKPIRTVVDAIGSMMGNPEYIRQGIKADPVKYSAAKQFASEVTKALHEETGIQQKALEASAGLFKSMPEFLGDSKLNRLAVAYIERNNDDWNKAVWEYISNSDPITVPTKNMSEALATLKKSGELKYYDALKADFKPEQMETLQKVSNRVTMFNEQRLATDIAHGVKFNSGNENLIENTEGYLKHVYEGDEDEVAQVLAGISDIEATNIGMNINLGSANKRRLQSLAMQKALRPDLKGVDNVIASMALREQESLRVELHKKLYGGIVDSIEGVGKIEGMDKLFSIKEPANNALNMRRIDIGKDANGHAVSLWAVPDMVGQLNRVAQSFSTNPGAKKMLEWYDKTTNIMKGLQTSANPAFAARNAIGETMMNWFAGVGLESHEQGAEIYKAVKGVQDIVQVGDGYFYKGKPLYRQAKLGNQDVIEYVTKATRDANPDDLSWATASKFPLKANNIADVKSMINADYGIKTYKIGEQELSAHDIMTLFREKGLGWSGITKGNLIKNTTKTIKDEIRGASGNDLQKVMQSVKDSGDYIETWTRLSHFVDRLNKGMSIDDAVADVRLYHVDYRNLTNVERNVFRRVMPYYTYMRKNLPIQMHTLLSAYNKVGMVTHLVDSSYEAIQRDNNGKELVVDDYLREGMALPLAVDDDGNITYLNWNLPINDLSRLKYNAGDFIDSNVMDMIHPFIRSWFELGSNTNMRFGTQIERFEGETTGILPGVEGSPQIPKVADYLMQNLGVVNTFRQAAGQAYNQVNGVDDPLNPTTPLAYAGLKSFVPVRSQQNAANNQAYDYRDQLQAYTQKLKSQGKYVPDYEDATSTQPTLFNATYEAFKRQNRR